MGHSKKILLAFIIILFTPLFLKLTNTEPNKVVSENRTATKFPAFTKKRSSNYKHLKRIKTWILCTLLSRKQIFTNMRARTREKEGARESLCLCVCVKEGRGRNRDSLSVVIPVHFDHAAHHHGADDDEGRPLNEIFHDHLYCHYGIHIIIDVHWWLAQAPDELSFNSQCSNTQAPSEI